MHVAEIRPAIFLRRDAGRVVQLCRVTIENSGPGAEARLIAEAAGERVETFLAQVPPGRSDHDAFVPEVIAACDLHVRISPGGPSAATFLWHPPKHLRVHVVQTSHHDVGYTDLASHAVPQHAAFLDAAIDMARATQDFPEDAQFRIVIEAAWSLLEFLKRAPSDRRAQMIKLLRAGRIELAALFGNVTTELCGHETLIRLLYPAFRLKREYGIPIVSAEHNDIPGISWGLCRALTGAGIRFFCPGLPLYYGWGGESLPSFWDEAAVFGRKGPGAFWWEAPSGKRLLFWCNNSGCGGDCHGTLPGLADRLQALADHGYVYNVLRWPVLGAARDNSPYIETYAHTIRDWNERWVFPRLICSTNARFFEELVPELPADLPVHRGELPGQDYPPGAMSTAHETTVNRNNHARVPAAEALATAASLATDLRYPRSAIEEAYEETLWHDEHTWGFHFPGHGPAAVAARFEKGVHAHRAAAVAHDVASKALARIADRVRFKTPGLHLIVFNPCPVPRSGVVATPFREADNCGSEIVEVPSTDGAPGYLRGVVLTDRWHVTPPIEFAQGAFDLVDEVTGELVAYEIREIASPHDPVPYAAERYGLSAGGKRYGLFELPVGLRRDLQFQAIEVPAMGYKTYRLAPRKRPQPKVLVKKRRGAAIENDHYRIDIEEGCVRIRDKETGCDLVDSCAPHRFGAIVVRDPDAGSEEVSTNVGAPVVRRGPVSDSLTWDAAAPGHPRIRRAFTLYRHMKRVEVAVRVLKDPAPLLDVHLAFPFAIELPRFRYEGVLSVMNPIADFLPGSQSDRLAVQNWVQVAGANATVVWSSLDAPIVSLGALWSGYVSPAHQCVRNYPAQHPSLTIPDLAHGHIYSNLFNNNFQTNFSVSQTGSVLFRYAFTTCARELTDTEAAVAAWDAVTPFETMFTEHERVRTLPLSDSYLRVGNPNVFLLAFKHAEDGNGLILRLWNMAPVAVQARVDLPHVHIARVVRTTICEEDSHELTEHDLRSFAADLGPQEAATFRIELAAIHRQENTH